MPKSFYLRLIKFPMGTTVKGLNIYKNATDPKGETGGGRIVHITTYNFH